MESIDGPVFRLRYVNVYRYIIVYQFEVGFHFASIVLLQFSQVTAYVESRRLIRQPSFFATC